MATSVRLIDLSRLLRGAGAQLDPRTVDFTRPLREISVYLGAQARRRFQQQASPDGVPWAPLKKPRRRPRDRRAAAAAARAGRRVGKQKVLIDTGILMGSMTGTAAAPHQGTVVTLTKIRLEQGTNIFYGHFHQYGTRKMVARPFAGINEKDADRITQFVADHLLRVAAARFGGP